jgi:hypothetical protein
MQFLAGLDPSYPTGGLDLNEPAIQDVSMDVMQDKQVSASNKKSSVTPEATKNSVYNS